MTAQKPPIVPMSSPDLTEAERQAVLEVLQTPNLSMGSRIDAFEQAFCAYTGSRFAIGVNSGTAGLHLCVRAAGIGPGDLVLTTPFSFVASTNVVLFEQALPVFVDVDSQTGNMDPLLVSEAVRDLMQGGGAAQRWLPRSAKDRPLACLKAILPVDVFGQPADLHPIRETAAAYGLRVIEDACEALGAEYKGCKAGTLGDAGVFAFYPNKQITTGEGGMVVTNDEGAASLMRALRNQGRAPGDTWLSHTYLGYNYRLDEMSAALGLVQMGRIEELLHKRDQVAQWYSERLAEIPWVEPPCLATETTRVSWFVYVVRLEQGVDRQAAAQALADRGIPVRPYFLPIHLQPYMVERFGYRAGDFPITEDLGERGLALPFSGKMTEKQVDLVCAALRDVFGQG
ncbi:MAG TPA: DegT/DnrJ/EryC1/StrS family aminotransferase [Anaerolineaceae bacterium]|nr:DegT/DnrJ/EryC1/StrS family aminotransferase [Anaerolineaceae bacterium]